MYSTRKVTHRTLTMGLYTCTLQLLLLLNRKSNLSDEVFFQNAKCFVFLVVLIKFALHKL